MNNVMRPDPDGSRKPPSSGTVASGYAEPEPEPSDRPVAKRRYIWVDNLRCLVILLVVNMHACVTYSHVGGWYYKSPHEPSFLEKLPFGLWQGCLQSFFMGILFFFAGYFTDRSLGGRRIGKFFLERGRRLGLPTLLYMLVLDPLIVLVILREDRRPFWTAYVEDYLKGGRFLGASGPMWFAFALLLMSVPAALFCRRWPRPQVSHDDFEFSPSKFIGIVVATGLATFLVRLSQPVGSSVFNFQLGYFTQYLVAFVLGIYVSRKDALDQIAQLSVARKLFWWAAVLGPLALIGIALTGGKDSVGTHLALDGGWNRSALAMALWEQFVGFSLSLGVMSYCIRRLNFEFKVFQIASERSFGVYLLHPPFLVAMSLVLVQVPTGPLLGSLLLTIECWIVTFFVAGLVLKTPLKSIL
jgi:fucose 4-O-acetylase-like acetyltransferase